jgi:membrane protein DedA with SNARE-associated domain
VSISQLVEGLITSAGYPAVLALVGAESLGIPLPGETSLVLASIYAGTTHQLSPWLIFAAAAGAPSSATTSASG